MKINKSSRAVILNSKGEILLFKFTFNMLKEKSTLWVTPGGKLKEGESFENALKREIEEETGMTLSETYPWIWTREIEFNGNDEKILSYERYYLMYTNTKEINMDKFTKNEKDSFKGVRWWSADEILNSDEVFGPPGIGILLRDIMNGRVPIEPMKID